MDLKTTYEETNKKRCADGLDPWTKEEFLVEYSTDMCEQIIDRFPGLLTQQG